MTSPSDIPIKAEILAAEEAGRNRVSILEAESGRIERLVLSQKRELVSLDGALNDIKNQIEEITLKRISIVNEITNLNKDKEILLADIKEMSLRNTETKAEIDLQQKELTERINIVTLRENAVQDRELSLSERIKTVEDDENIIKVKKLTLSEALAQL